MKIFKYITLLLISLSLLGCATNYPHKVACPVAKNSKIGIVSMMGGKAVQFGCTNQAANFFLMPWLTSMKTLSNFDYDQIISGALKTNLNHCGFKCTEIIQHPGGNPTANMSLEGAAFTNFDDEPLAYLKKITKTSCYDYFIIVVPDFIDCKVISGPLVHFRYGMSYVSNFIKPYFFAAYNILIVDGKTYQILAKRHADIVYSIKDCALAQQVLEDTNELSIFKSWLKQCVTKGIVSKTLIMLNTGYVEGRL